MLAWRTLALDTAMVAMCLFFFSFLVVDLAAWQQHQTGCAVPGRVSDRRADRKPRQRPTAATAARAALASITSESALRRLPPPLLSAPSAPASALTVPSPSAAGRFDALRSAHRQTRTLESRLAWWCSALSVRGLGVDTWRRARSSLRAGDAAAERGNKQTKVVGTSERITGIGSAQLQRMRGRRS